MSRNLLAASMNTDLYTAVYEELKRVAHRHLNEAGGADTLSTTELVHEAYLKLSQGEPHWENRGHFFGAASRAMRQVLVDFARRKRAGKRGGIDANTTLRSGDAGLEVALDDLLSLDAALNRLDAVDHRLREVVELRFFGGLPEAEVAEVLGVSTRTVERDWLKARLFLLNELEPANNGSRRGAAS